jgi:hypothetical protein
VAFGGVGPPKWPALTAALEELYGTLVLLCSGARSEGAEILTMLRGRIDLAGIQAIFAAWKFSDHGGSKANSMPSPQSAESPFAGRNVLTRPKPLSTLLSCSCPTRTIRAQAEVRWRAGEDGVVVAAA